jgi:hypothetical protein
MQTRESTALQTQTPPQLTAQLSGQLPHGYAQQAIRLERALGWVLWIALAAVLVSVSV